MRCALLCCTLYGVCCVGCTFCTEHLIAFHYIDTVWLTYLNSTKCRMSETLHNKYWSDNEILPANSFASEIRSRNVVNAMNIINWSVEVNGSENLFKCSLIAHFYHYLKSMWNIKEIQEILSFKMRKLFFLHHRCRCRCSSVLNDRKTITLSVHGISICTKHRTISSSQYYGWKWWPFYRWQENR